MGGSESKHKEESQKLNTSLPGEDENHTPLVNKRLTRLTDPRSPTEGVERTPIIAEKPDENASNDKSQVLRIDTSMTPEVTDAPDPRSPSANVARTPQPFTFQDPRSPAAGDVTRTPFIPHLREDGDPRSPTPGVERTPYIPKEEQEPVGPRTSSFECLVDDPTTSVQENLNSSNSNVDDEDDSLTELEPDSHKESETLLKTQKIKPEGLTQIDTPQYEVELSKMVEQQSLVTVYCDPEEIDSQEEEEDGPGIITTTDASAHKTKPKRRKKSLKDKVQEKFHGGAPRPEEDMNCDTNDN